MTLPLLSEEVSGADVLPEQFDDIWRRSASVRPESELELEMIVQAIEDLRSPAGKRKRAFCDAVQWVASEDERWPFSFRNVCADLGLDPDAVRRRLIGDGPPADVLPH